MRARKRETLLLQGSPPFKDDVVGKSELLASGVRQVLSAGMIGARYQYEVLWENILSIVERQKEH